MRLTETPGTGQLDIIDTRSGRNLGELRYASSVLTTTSPLSQLETVTSVSWPTEIADAFAFWTGDLDVVLAYQGPGGNRLVDTSLVIQADGAVQARWDELMIPHASVGVHVAQVTTGGGQHATAQIRVVDLADSLSVLVNSNAFSCVGAFSLGSFVSHAPITFTLNGVATASSPMWGPNCLLTPAGSTVVATVPGATVTFTVASNAAPVSPEELATLRAEIQVER